MALNGGSNACQYILVVVPASVERGGQGGVAQIASYLAEAWRDNKLQPPLRFLQARGPGSVLLSPFYLLHCLSRLLFDGIRGRIVLVHVHLSSHGSVVRKLLVVILASLLGLPVILHLHGSRFDSFFSALPAPLRWPVVRLFKMADRVIVLGEDWRRFITDKVGVEAARVHVLHNVVPDPHRSGKSTGSPRTSIPRILFAGRVGERKGVPELLQALAEKDVMAQQWNAVIAGDGDIEPYRRLAERLGIGERVEFTGWLGPEAIAQHYANADMFVLPSHAEGLSVALLEAMAHGLAIITTPVGSQAEAISDGVNGLLVDPGDVAGLARGLHLFLSDEEHRRRLGLAARQTFLHSFEAGSAALALSALFDDCLAAIARRRGAPKHGPRQ